MADDIKGRIKVGRVHEEPEGPGDFVADVTIEGGLGSFLSRAASGSVTLQRSERLPTIDQPLWAAIRNRTTALSFPHYRTFLTRVLCFDPDRRIIPAPDVDCDPQLMRLQHGLDAHTLLKVTTEVFLLRECGVYIKAPEGVPPFADAAEVPGEASRLGEPITFGRLRDLLAQYLGGVNRLPYLTRIVDALSLQAHEEESPFCYGILRTRYSCPCLLELIWSYWHEEGMLVQTLNAVSMRFQNRRIGTGRDPLAQMELDPLRPLNNFLWGYIQDEQHRLSVPRRAYEYDHHYGLSLYGKAVPDLQAADSRSKFLEAFHDLLHRAAIFFQEDADTTVISDAFPLLNAIKEIHLILAYGAHNQYGDLPWTARAEMLIQQFLVARPEMREFLPSRTMVPYREAWMGQVDSMKTLQGWTDVTVTHFNELAVYGEQLLLSLRFGDWSAVTDAQQAKNWARYWRPEMQGYIHAYRAVTGVDLAADVVDVGLAANRYIQPSIHLRNRLEAQRRGQLGPGGYVLPTVPSRAQLPAPRRTR